MTIRLRAVTPFVRLGRALRTTITCTAAVMAYVAGWNYIACAVFITADIVGRSLFGVSSAATVEVTGYMLACGISWALAHTLVTRAHIRVDALVNRLPLRPRVVLHILAAFVLFGFASFLAWASWSLVRESILFDAHDSSALHLPMVLPQGIWAFGTAIFLLAIIMLLIQSSLAMIEARYSDIEVMLGSRSIDDEAAEALDAVAMARSSDVQ